MELRLDRAAIESIHHHAREAYPEECCGIVLCGASAGSVRRITNIQNRLHAEDPVQHPRDAKIAYFMDPKELYSVLSDAERGRQRILAFYHSHPEHGAYFSDEDRARAMAWDEPAYPEAFHLVISVVGGEVSDQIAVGWSAERREFVPADLIVV